MSFANYVQKKWYESRLGVWWLWPLFWLFGLIAFLRYKNYQKPGHHWKAPFPLIVIGNITVGGTGKTPLTVRLVKALREKGFKPGIVSRGYGGQSENYPLDVTMDAPASLVGDEPLMLRLQTDCPVVVSPKRVDAVKYLLDLHDCDLIISDDGLQHYALDRDVEICVMDAARGVGCAKLLPVGPLREPVTRLSSVDFLVENISGQSTTGQPEALRQFGDWRKLVNESEWPVTGKMTFAVSGVYSLCSSKTIKGLSDFAGRTVHGVAGIGNPDRFFSMLDSQGIKVIKHSFADHHAYSLDDLSFNDDLPILMTDKDAVKCNDLADSRMWRVSIEADIEGDFIERVIDYIQTIKPASTLT